MNRPKENFQDMSYFGNRGFTMIELMITALIAAIVLSIAVPSLTRISNEIRFNSVRQRLILDLTYTRSEAVNQGGQVVICPSDSIEANLVSCSTDLTDWSDGWIIFTDNDNNGIFNPPLNRTSTDPRAPRDDFLLKTSQVDSNALITWNRTGTISFDGEGQATTDGSFKLCDFRGDTSIAKGVTLALSGRTRSTDSVTCP